MRKALSTWGGHVITPSLLRLLVGENIAKTDDGGGVTLVEALLGCFICFLQKFRVLKDSSVFFFVGK